MKLRVLYINLIKELCFSPNSPEVLGRGINSILPFAQAMPSCSRAVSFKLQFKALSGGFTLPFKGLLSTISAYGNILTISALYEVNVVFWYCFFP